MTIYPAAKPPPKPETPKKPPRKRNTERLAKERLRAYGPPERRAFVKSLKCLARGCPRPSENAHIESGGKSRKADADKIVPLCRRAHEIFHAIGRESFERSFGINLEYEADRVERLWQSHLRESK